MSYKTVTREQFELSRHAVVHIPTGARFTAYPNIADPHLVNWGNAGNVLENGDDFDRNEIAQWAKAILSDRELETLD